MVDPIAVAAEVVTEGANTPEDVVRLPVNSAMLCINPVALYS